MTDCDVTENMAVWILEELRYKARIFETSGAVSVFNGDVVQSDVAVTKAVKEVLKKSAARLENVPQHSKDYHPGSDELVLDLVHPSLFPLVYGRTRILPKTTLGVDDCITTLGAGTTLVIRSEDEAQMDEKDRHKRCSLHFPESKIMKHAYS